MIVRNSRHAIRARAGDRTPDYVRRLLATDGSRHGVPGGPKWRRRKADRPTEILEAALKVFRKRSVSAATLEEIAQEAGVRRSTIYVYFKNKEEIFGELSRCFLPDVPDSYTLNRQLRPLQVREQLRALVRIVNAALIEPRVAALLRLVIAEAHNFPEIAQAYRAAIDERVHRPLVSVIKKGIAKRKFRPVDPDVAARLAAAVPASAAFWDTSLDTAAAESNASDRWDSSSMLEAHIDFFLEAMTS